MKYNRFTFIVLLTLFTQLLCSGLQAQETSIMIRAKAKDAKFIGTSMGGARIVVKNTLNGEILAQGITEGGTGDTKIIMQEPHKRHQQLTDGNTAGFLATLDIREPVFVTIEAYAPLNYEQAIVKATTQLWVIPGKDITGNGIVMEFPGFVVAINMPENQDQKGVEINARIVMMCGCPISPEGLWEASQYEVMALISAHGEIVQKIKLQVKEEPSIFLGKADLEPGSYAITVYAFDPITGNTGLDRSTFVVK